MEIIRDMDWCPRPAEGTVATIGVYDGVHRGHRTVIAEMHRMAAEWGARTAVVTFDPHPASVVRPESAPQLLTNLDQRLELLAETGVDYSVVIEFNEEKAAESADDFARGLVECLRPKAMVVGEDFHFGHGREGDVPRLRRLGETHGFDVHGLKLVQQRDEAGVISSTNIRNAVAEGDMKSATRMLGRHLEIRGVVTPGDRRGRTIGFPTANVPTDAHVMLPADGVYACWYLRPDGSQLPAAVNVGKRPTFYDDAARSLTEAHIIGFRGDVYDEPARVQFVERLRGERKFDGIDSLKAQLAADVERAQQILDSAS